MNSTYFQMSFVCLVIKLPSCIFNVFFSKTELTSVRRNAFLVVQRCSSLQSLVSYKLSSLLSDHKINSFFLLQVSTVFSLDAS